MSFSEWVSLGSFIVAMVALIKSFLSDRKVKSIDLLLKQKELEKSKKADAESQKADIEVNTVETSSGQANKLRFYNKGMSEARNVSFEIKPKEMNDNIQLNIASDYLPFPKLLPQQNFDIFYLKLMVCPPHQTIEITWDDNFAKNRSRVMVVDM